MTHWRNILEKAVTPVALCSFGKDSILMLDLMREVRQDFPVIHFGKPDKFAEGIIRQWNLTVFSYAPAQRQILLDGENTVLVSDYSFGGAYLPVIEDIDLGETCCGAFNEGPRLSAFDYDWSDTFIGWKSCDSHPILTTQPNIVDGMALGNTKLWAPLRDYTDSDVYQALFDRGLPIPERDRDTKFACTRCLRGPAFCPMEGGKLIPAHQWSPDVSLEAFRQRFTDAA